MKLSRGQKIHLTIDRLSVGGRGVGRYSIDDSSDSRKVVVFVSDTTPGDSVEVEIVFVKKSFAEARLLQVLNASTNRIEPPCPVAGVCGGCNWQHLKYETQLEWKRELVRESLRKFSGFDVSEDSRVSTVVPSPDEFRYRNRVQFHHENGKLGFYQRGSHRIVDIDDCPITETAIAYLIPEFKRRFANQAPGRFEAYISEEGPVRTRGPGHGSIEEPEEQGGLNFSFSQVNTNQNENLVRDVVEIFSQLSAAVSQPAIFDLYSGAGNFSFPILNALPTASLTAVELNAQSVERGRAKSQSLYPNRKIQWHAADVLTFLKQSRLPDGALVLIDPPRTGCDPEVMKILANSRISHLVYVSCHPVTLARDLAFMKEAGFDLKSVKPFDMFPQTDHVETLVFLTRETIV